MVLVFASVLLMMILTLLETNWMQSKIANAFKNEKLNFIRAEQALENREKCLESTPLKPLPIGCHPIQFVPDTLTFAESKGVFYYEFEIIETGSDGTQTHLKSVVGSRRSSR